MDNLLEKLDIAIDPFIIFVLLVVNYQTVVFDLLGLLASGSKLSLILFLKFCFLPNAVILHLFLRVYCNHT